MKASRPRRLATLSVTLMLGVTASACAKQAAGGDHSATDGNIVHVVCGATEDWCAATTRKFTETTGQGRRRPAVQR